MLEELHLELPFAILGHQQLQLAHPRLQHPRLESVPPAPPFRVALIRPAPRKLVISASSTCGTKRSTRLRRKSSSPRPCHPSTIPIPCLLRAIEMSSSRNVVPTSNILRRTQVARSRSPRRLLLQNFKDSIPLLGHAPSNPLRIRHRESLRTQGPHRGRLHSRLLGMAAR